LKKKINMKKFLVAMKTVPISKGVISKATYKYLFLLFLYVIGPFSPSSASHWMQEKNPPKFTRHGRPFVALFRITGGFSKLLLESCAAF
jgi:hypothetical protein